MAKSVPQVRTGVREVDQLQSNVVPPLNYLLGNPLANGNLLRTDLTPPLPAVAGLGSGVPLSGITIAAATSPGGVLTLTPTRINHGLNRPLIGWCVTRKRQDGGVFDLQDTLSLTDQQNVLLLTTNSTTPVTIDLFVF